MACEKCGDPGTFWQGTPAGKEIKLGNGDAYISTPSGGGSSSAVILVGDIFGWQAKNTRLYTDKLAAAGFIAVLPDHFRSDLPPLADIAKGDFSKVPAWREVVNDERVMADNEAVIAGLKNDYGVDKVSAIGFCWGGRHACNLGASDKVQAIAVNHGSFVDMELAEKIKQPVMFNCGSEDTVLPQEVLARIRGVVECKKDLPSDFKVYEGMVHGYSNRGDDKDPKVAAAIQDTFDRVVDWFKKYGS